MSYYFVPENILSMSKTKALFKPLKKEAGTKENPWNLTAYALNRNYEIYKDEDNGQEILVCKIGKCVFHYDYRCITDLYCFLHKEGQWLKVGAVDEKKKPEEGTIEAWARSQNNPIGEWYGLNEGHRGNFGMFVPPLMKHLRLAEVDIENDRIKAL
jgi:hypothetical protein